uniref:Groucho/TLE N-terminal Q-rich domain-containing protein n=1 Tax=Prolemur simus TaxID=1328070 RepID=A0A8C9DJS3_PROSS
NPAHQSKFFPDDPAVVTAQCQPFKFTILESLDQIKEKFQFLQVQCHHLKMECEKLASENTKMRRHYVMYYEMSCGLNTEMHKQTEITKHLNPARLFWTTAHQHLKVMCQCWA